jgi:hypothetical protein
MKKLVISLCLALTVSWVSVAGAVLIDPYDNFLAPDVLPFDNFLAPEGYYGLLYGNYYSADKFVTSEGNVDIDLKANVAVVRGLKYFTLLDIPMAFQVIVPFGKVEEKKVFNESSSGLGDIAFGPAFFLYANDDNLTYLSYWFYIFAPTGEWDRNQAINLGLNTWYFEHQLAFAKMLGNFVYDMNLNYYHFQKESDHNYRAPDRFELEASLAYQLTEQFVVGIHGGGYWDRGHGKVDGVSIEGTKAKRVMVGPSVGYQFTERIGANLRWSRDVSASNDTKGDDVWVRLAYAF